jgi:hypothetical protein
VLPPEIFKGNQNKAEDFIQDFNLCWHLNHQHTAMKHPYDCIMLALSYMQEDTTIRNWVKYEMRKINAMTSITN